MITEIKKEQQKNIFIAEIVCISIILFTFILLQYDNLSCAPWAYYNAWRQSDTYSIALNYIQYDMNLLHPQLNYDGVADNYAQLELQILPYLTVIFYKITGIISPLVARSFSLVFFVGSAIFLYLLMRRTVSIIPAIMGLCIYLALPLSFLLAPSIQPESCTLFFYCGGVYFLYRFYESKKSGFAITASAMTALAIIEKTPAAFVGILFFFVFFQVYKRKCFKTPLFYGCLITTLLPPITLISYTSSHSTLKLIDGIAGKHIFSEKIFSFFTQEGIEFFRACFETHFSPLLLLAIILGILLLFRKEFHFYLVWTIAFVLECIIIVAVIRFEYYLIFILPICAVCISILFSKIYRKQKIIAIMLFVAILVSTLTITKDIPSLQKEDPHIGNAGIFIQENIASEDPIAIGITDPTYINAANRRGYRANINYYEEIPTGPKEETDYFINKGVRWFIVIDGQICNDTDGSYLKYLQDTFPIAAEGNNCTIFNLQEVK